jgi:hypothetical protein
VLLLLVLSLCHLPDAFSSPNSFSALASDSRRLQPFICSCAPINITFELDLTLTGCPQAGGGGELIVNVDKTNPGILGLDCANYKMDSREPITDFVPVVINKVQVNEYYEDHSSYSRLYLDDIEYKSGFTFQYTSLLSEDPQLRNIPTWFEIILRGENQFGEAIGSGWQIKYVSNNCNTEPIITPRINNTTPSIGWTKLVCVYIYPTPI